MLRKRPFRACQCFNGAMPRIAIFLLSCCLLTAFAQARQDPVPVRKAVESWLANETQGLSGQVSLEIGDIAPENRFAPCTSFDVSRPSGTQSFGRISVMVRCVEGASWRVYLPVHIRVKTDYLVSARPIAQGQVLNDDDLALQSGDLSELPARILSDASQAVGKAAAVAIPAGRPLRTDMLKAVIVIRQGQSVKVVSRGAGFEVANEGKALNNAAAGQVVQIKLGSGRIVSGVAKAGGSIELDF